MTVSNVWNLLRLMVNGSDSFSTNFQKYDQISTVEMEAPVQTRLSRSSFVFHQGA